MKYILRLLLASSLVSSCFAVAPSSTAARASRAVASQPQAKPSGAGAELGKGKSLLRRGRAGEALIHLESALALYRQAKSRAGEAATRDLLGELYERQGQYDTALEHFRAALAIFAGGAADTEKTKAVASEVGSKVPVSQAAGASKLVVNFDAYHANLMLSKIGQMLYRQGRTDEARAAFSQMRVSRPDTSKLGKAKGFGKLLGGLSVGIGSDDAKVGVPTSAIGAALTVKDRFEIYHQTIIYATHELGMGRLAFRANDLEAARTHFENALEATKGDLPFVGNLGQSRRFRAAARTGLADVALRQGRYPDALKQFQEAAKGAEKDKRLDLMWPAQRGAGRARWLQAAQERDAKKADKLRQESLASYRDALKTIEAVRSGSLRADESRTTFLATTRMVFDEAAAAFAETALAGGQVIAQLEGKSLEYAAEAFRVVEQGRARSLLDMLGESGAQITEGVPAELLQRKQENLDKQNEIASQLTGVSPTYEAPSKSVEDLEKELDKLQSEFDSIENQIRAASPRYNALTAAQPLTLAEVQTQVLDDSTALLEYALGDEASYLWAVTKERTALYKLPPRETINKQVAELRDQIIPVSLRRSLIDVGAADAQRTSPTNAQPTTPNTQAFAAVSNALYKTVVEPAASVFGARRLAVVSDGALAYVPFEALVTASSTSSDYSTLPYLIKTNEIVYAPSSSVIAAVRRQAESVEQPRSILLIADPVFDPSDTRTKKQAATAHVVADASRGITIKSAVADVSGSPAKTAGGFRLARLAGTRTEAEQVAVSARAAGVKADVWLDFEASEENTGTRDLTSYRIIHFATHGLLNTERPQFTGLVLSLVGNRAEDGFLRTDEVFNLRLGRPFVMLSACETALGRERRGEGVMGLTRAFMYAGAPSVGVTLWAVADRPTAELMTDFYKRLLAKDSAGTSQALRAARLHMIEEKRYAAPFYWAPFVLAGDWR